MAKKYANLETLEYFLSKIKNLISGKQNKITYGSAEPTGGEDGDVYLKLSSSDNSVDKVGDLSTLTTDDRSSVVAAINELNDIHSMSICLSANANITVSTTWTYTKLNLATDKAVIGSGKLIKQNGTVKIGAGVKYVRISGNGMLRGIANTSQVVTLMHNNTQLGAGYFSNSSTSAWGTIGISPITIPVQEGDIIALAVGAGATGTLVVAGGTYTYINVEVVG